ncbi:MAG: hypothetical protein JWS10_2733 [Cypionkella sp.]|uniref:CopD family protein n=1 Tax=Cypionkella sp. TaxID=2811411 RepID=UPI002633D633|nr:CopD family protein [Cypionkella sp.]MDB5660118.1 hypothetical protein [Cypionkella sp.]
MSWVEGLVAHIKALHLSFVAVWVAGLVALPLMLARHDRSIVQAEFAQIRRATHFGYVWVITPVAVLAIASGTALIFMREVFTMWIFAKLVLVTGLVAMHAWVGHTIISVAETEGQHEPPGPMISVMLVCGLALCILGLVLGKPELEELPVPSWLLRPLGYQLPFAIPNR